MSTFSVAEAKNKLSDLIGRALRGEGVVITRHGSPVVEIKPVHPTAKPVTADDIEWLAARRIRPKQPVRLGCGDLVSSMRDEDEH